MFRPLLIATLLASSTAHAAAKPTAPGTNTPEIVYTLATAKGYELKVANEDGTGAITLYTGAGITISKFGPRATKNIAFYGGNNMYLLTYDVSSTGVVKIGQRFLFDNGRSNGAPSPFDYNGTYIAWWHPENGDLRLYDVRDGSGGVVINVPNLSGISFSSDGSEIFYGDGGSGAPYRLHRIPIAGGTPTPVGVDANVGTFDSGHKTDAFAIAAPLSGSWYLTHVPAGASSGRIIARAVEGSFRCDDKVIIYRMPAGNGYDTLKYDLETKLSSTFSTNNSVKFASYMPDCP